MVAREGEEERRGGGTAKSVVATKKGRGEGGVCVCLVVRTYTRTRLQGELPYVCIGSSQ